MRYNNNLYLVNKYVILKLSILCGFSFGEDRQMPKGNGFCLLLTSTRFTLWAFSLALSSKSKNFY